MSYSARITDLSRRAAFFVDRILKGTKPNALPIEQPTTFELLINLRTAKALGVTPTPNLLAIADEVIE
jgi:putative ABC transport system substrate-binding protein